MMTRIQLDLMRARLADAGPQARSLVGRLAIAACEQEQVAVGGTLDDIRDLIEGLVTDAEQLLEGARLTTTAAAPFDIIRDRFADAVPQSRHLLDRLAIAACEQEQVAVGGTLDDIRDLIEGLVTDAEQLLTDHEQARLADTAGPLRVGVAA